MTHRTNLLPMETIKCEAGCEQVIAVADTYDEAVEIAKYEKNASDNDGEVWECEACQTKRYAEGSREAARFVREEQQRRYIKEAEDEREAVLEAADWAYDSARDRGEI